VKILFALPAYNEEAGLPKLLDAFHDQMIAMESSYQVVIVDDGSTDRTRDIVREWSQRMPIDLVHHEKNAGLGKTIQDVLYRATELAESDDIVVTMDADNTHSPALIPEMVRKIAAGADVVIASRYRKGSRVVGLSLVRKFMSQGARVLFQVVFPIPGVRDYTCGFRAYRARVLRAAFTRYGRQLAEEPGFAAMAEILLKLSRLRLDEKQGPAGRPLEFRELPMVLRYDLKGGASKMKVGSTVMKTLKMMMRLRSSTGIESAAKKADGPS